MPVILLIMSIKGDIRIKLIGVWHDADRAITPTHVHLLFRLIINGPPASIGQVATLPNRAHIVELSLEFEVPPQIFGLTTCTTACWRFLGGMFNAFADVSPHPAITPFVPSNGCIEVRVKQQGLIVEPVKLKFVMRVTTEIPLGRLVTVVAFDALIAPQSD